MVSANRILDTVHRQIDAMLLVQIARIIMQIEDAHAQIVAHGAVTTTARGTSVTAPYARQERRLIDQLRALHGEFGLSPVGRLRIVPRTDGRTSEAAEWGAIDIKS